MSFRSVFLITSILLASLYIYILNPDEVTIHLTTSTEYKTPVLFIVFISFFLGIASSYIVNLLKKSRNVFDRLKKGETRNIKEEKADILYLKGLNYLMAGQRDDAIKLFKEVMEKEPDHLKTLQILGNCFREESNFDEAINLHARAYNNNPRNLEILYNLEMDYEGANRLHEAINMLNEIRNIDKGSFVSFYKLRDIFVKMERWEDAYDIQQEILNQIKDPIKFLSEKQTLGNFCCKVGFSNLKNKNFDEAIRTFKNALGLNSQFASAYLGLGETYLAMDKEKLGLKIWEKGYRSTKAITFLKHMEDYYYKIGRPDLIIKTYSEAQLQNSDDYLLKLALGEVYLRLEMLDEALEELRKVEMVYHNLPSYHYLIGMIYERKDETELSLREYKKASEESMHALLNYNCNKCGFVSKDWVDRCPVCKEWNTFNLGLPKKESDENLTLPEQVIPEERPQFSYAHSEVES